jgi:hypothetical protein
MSERFIADSIFNYIQRYDIFRIFAMALMPYDV